MIQLSEKATGAVIGSISEEELEFLIGQLEEESLTDQDYWLNREELKILKEDGAGEHLITLLENAMGEREELEIQWTRVV